MKAATGSQLIRKIVQATMTLLKIQNQKTKKLFRDGDRRSADNSRVFRSIDCDVIHLFADNVSLDWHAIGIVVDALYYLSHDVCACVSFFVDYCKRTRRRNVKIPQNVRQNPGSTYLVGTH